jgi:hypothetical protein
MSLVARNALIALCITILIVGTIAYAVRSLGEARIRELTEIENQIALDTLSLETEFALLATAPCENATSTESISELAELGERLSFTEEELGSDHKDVIDLKKRYTILEIKDYLATQEIARSCGTKPLTVLYFYSNQGDCPDCDRAGYALSYLRDTNPTLRVYSFDYNLDLGALRTLTSINKLDSRLPAFVIQGKTSYGFDSLDEFVRRFPKGALATSTTTR